MSDRQQFEDLQLAYQVLKAMVVAEYGPDVFKAADIHGRWLEGVTEEQIAALKRLVETDR